MRLGACCTLIFYFTRKVVFDVGKSSSHYTITPRVLAGVKQREDAIVALIEEGADPDLVRAEYYKLWNYLRHHVFPKRWAERGVAFKLDFAAIVRHQWANRVNVPFQFSYYPGLVNLRPNEAIAYLRNTSLILQSAAQFMSVCTDDELEHIHDFRDGSLRISMAELIDRAIKIANPAKTHHIIVEGKGALASLNNQVGNGENKFRNFSGILELLTNAVKYSPAGSTITLYFRHTATREFYFDGKEVTPEGDYVDARVAYKEPHRVDYFFATVADEGIGIPADEIGRVCEEGYRASNAADIPGTGFGLNSIDLGNSALELPIKISSPPPRRKNYDPNFPGTEVRICLANW